MLINWLSQSFQSLTSSLNGPISETDLNGLTIQYCTNLLVAGVIKQLDDKASNQDAFKVSKIFFFQ
jgi:formin 2